MELIKPFVKYSRMYRRTTDSGVKQSIYNQWRGEVRQHVDELDDAREQRLCGFCYAPHTAAHRFCTQCLFPLRDEEFITYCMLSVCYYETSCDSPTHRNVYRQRLKMTWYEHERQNKLYEVAHRRCIQCRQLCRNVGAKFTYFNDKMFCSKCLFPMFIVTIY
ncbi:ac52-like protein [Peridroma alphabaculovirus]|uniref:Ac52-like protein n=1 Tax=Peridroma alphabaculovirus TaxID=1346829 RepID=A0A068LK78_9ABAC|nr:ac52-like protein [Peridroma alphabaculovirus]AIE47774.1 ac52-like protein [Peridroma alphabaculovirus]